jgi:hypothetical protein
MQRFTVTTLPWKRLLQTRYNTYNNQVKEDDMGRVRNIHGEKGSTYRVLVGKPEGTRPFRRPR